MTVTGVRVLGGRYELGQSIGRGGMAEVYRATDLLLARPVAIKVLRAGAAEPGIRERFTAEARTLASLNHPGLVTLLDAGIGDEQPYLVMELVEGPSLSAAIREGGPLDPVWVTEFGAQTARALAYAHRQGVVHRDVKPGNILITSDRRALLADFGIARLLGDDGEHTRTGETIGSPAYLSPEQVNGEPITEAVDVYSLGLVLLEALTGRRAYSGTPVEAALARLTASPAIPTSLDRHWRDLLLAMTRREPAERPTAEQVADLLARPVAAVDDPTVATGGFVVAPVGDPLADAEHTVVGLPVQPTRRRRPSALWLLGSAAAAVILFLGGLMMLNQSPSSTGSPLPASTPSRSPHPSPIAATRTPVAPRTTAAAKPAVLAPATHAAPKGHKGKHGK